jgi:hypothetical protein
MENTPHFYQALMAEGIPIDIFNFEPNEDVKTAKELCGNLI